MAEAAVDDVGVPAGAEDDPAADGFVADGVAADGFAGDDAAAADGFAADAVGVEDDGDDAPPLELELELGFAADAVGVEDDGDDAPPLELELELGLDDDHRERKVASMARNRSPSPTCIRSPKSGRLPCWG